MALNKMIGDLIAPVSEKNKELKYSNVLGVAIEKEFMPSVANLVGTDLSKYSVLRKDRFAFNPMHVGRDKKLPIALYRNDEPALISPAYEMFEITATDIVDKNYLMLFFKNPQFDHECWFHTDSTVRGGMTWEDFCNTKIELPDIKIQRKIVNNYNYVVNRAKTIEETNRKIYDILNVISKKFINNIGNENNIKISDVADIVSETDNPKKREGNIYYLDTGNITENYIDELKIFKSDSEDIPSSCKKVVNNGDVIFSAVRPNLKHFGLINNQINNLFISTAFHVLRVKDSKKFSSEVLCFCMADANVLSKISEIAAVSVTTYPRIDDGDLMNIELNIKKGFVSSDYNALFKIAYNYMHYNNEEKRRLNTIVKYIINYIEV